MESGPAWTRRETVETTLSAFGAGFIGIGAGLVLGVQSTALGWPILVAGLLAHALGMAYLHRRRQGHGDEQPKWLEAAYTVEDATRVTNKAGLTWVLKVLRPCASA